MKTILTILILLAGGLGALVFILSPAGNAAVSCADRVFEVMRRQKSVKLEESR